ncbi:MAG: hypothetical protein CL908_19985 [Deltaproteobacteria bacterium]|jgi:hypothetical protein|nr:hypothetical protein [Deltaproteobacteria bacterium]
MFIVWGKKERRQKSGFVAEICPACKAILPHHLIELREAPHIYYARIGRGKIVGYQTECHQCSEVQSIHPSRYDARLDLEIEIDRLVDLTHPGLPAELAAHRDREDRAERGEIEGEERIKVMQEALYTVASAVEKKSTSGGGNDPMTLYSFLATLILPWFVAVPGFNNPGPVGEALLWAGLAVFAIGLAATFYLYRTSLRRFIQRTQGEAIVDALRDYNPSPTELVDLADGLRESDSAIGKSVDTKWLVDLFHSVGAITGTPIA